jgi:endonuclease/exonuclease/phosphatase family metal-dependent hydrolase
VKRPSHWLAFARRWAIRLAWLYLALIVCFWLFLRQGDDWWPATVALYAPRWPFGVPLLLLLPAALRWPRRVGLPVAAATVVFVWPVLDAAVNVPSRDIPPTDESILRVMSFNADGGHFSREALEVVLEAETPDIVAVQESCPDLTDPNFWGAGWNVHSGPAGLLIASRYELHPVRALSLASVGGNGGATRVWLDCPFGKLTLVDVHLDTPRSGLEAMMHGQNVDVVRANIALRDAGSAAVIQWLGDAPAMTVVAGDFNMTTDSVIYRNHWSRYLLDSYDEAGLGWGYTKHTRWHGVRIDHVLHGPVMRCRECRVCTDVGSDHQPVIAILSRARETVR